MAVSCIKARFWRTICSRVPWRLGWLLGIMSGMTIPKWGASLIVLLMLFWGRQAQACGGCFAPPQASVSQVTGHRMAFAVSEERTVLWDQFQYSGSPEEFAWVLPVAPGAFLEEAHQAWFDALDAATDVQVTGPALNCASGGSSGCGVMASSDAQAARGGGSFDGEGSVQVLDRRTVGPYDVVTLRTTNGDELFQWFDDNGYFVPEDIAPIIDEYVAEGSDFIAVKLRPGQGVQQMTPVRVITPGGKGILPLRMVAAGVGLEVDIVLYVIGHSRYGMPDLVEVAVDPQDLVWDFQKSDSNYLRLRDAALTENGGYSFLTAFAEPGVLLQQGLRNMVSTGGSFVTSIPALYFTQASENDGIESLCQGVEWPSSGQVVVEDWESQTLPASGALACGGYSDLAQALVGLRPDSTWLTRLELRLPRSALSMDCVVEPNERQAEVSSSLSAVRSEGRPDGCEEVVFTSGLGELPKDPTRVIVWLLLSALAAYAVRRLLGSARTSV